MQVEDLTDVADEYLAGEVEDRFKRLDKRLSAALRRIVHGELGRRMTERANTCMREKRQVRGRELLRMIVRHFQSNDMAEKVYRIGDLLEVE